MLPSQPLRLPSSSGGRSTLHAASSSSNSWRARQRQQHAASSSTAQQASVPAELRVQHQALAGKLEAVLRSREQPQQQQVAAAAELVLQGSAALTASADWQLLQQALGQAAARRNSQAAGSAPPGGGAAARPAGGFGFALRQPGTRPQAPPLPAAVAPPQQQQQQQQWAWPAVQQLTLLGLGSISAAGSSGSSGNGGNGGNINESTGRLRFRFSQLALAHALAQPQALPGLAAAPLAFDPAYDEWDAQLLSSLGFRVAQQQPSWMLDTPSLLYMPCCPRELYDAVVAANWSSSERLQRLAILGSSMRSLTDTQGLLQALVTQGAAGHGGMRAMSAVQQAYAQGRVVEVPCPDCAAHGVGVAVHLFLPSRS